MARIAALVAAVVVALLLWIALSWSVAPDEWIVGLPAACFAAVVADRAFRLRGRLPPRSWATLARLPVDIARDTVRIFIALAKNENLDAGLAQADAGHIDPVKRAWLTAMLSTAPGTIVVSIDVDTGRVVSHRVVPAANDVARILGAAP